MRKFLPICLIGILGAGMLYACAAHQPTQHRLDDDAVENSEVTENTDVAENTDVTENVDVVEASVTDYLLPPEYDYIHAFKGGYGMISKGDVMQLINAEGQIISPPTPTTCIISSINQNKKIEIKSLENQLYGLMDMDGNILIAPEYEYPLTFSEGLAAIIQDGKISYINENNEVVIASRYDWALSFHCGLAAVGIDDEFWFIDTEGNIASGPYEYLDVEIFTFNPAYMDYYEGYTAYFEYNSEMDPQGYNPGGYWGYLNKKGEEVIPAQFISVRPFHEGLAAAQKKDGQWIYINTEGKEVFNGAPCDFNEGLACLGGSFINKLGETVITLPENYYVPHSTMSGFDNFHHGLIVLFADNKGKSFNAVMNRSGEILLESNDYEEIKVIYENLIAVKTNGKWGVIDLS